MARTSRKSEAELREAVQRGDVAEVGRLLRNGGDPNLPGLILEAVHSGDIATLEELIQAGADVNADGGGVTTPLIMAVDGGHTEVTLRLLEAGGNPNAESRTRQTPLARAALRGNVPLVRALLKSGARADHIHPCTVLGRSQPARHGWTALMVACHAGHDEVAKLLLQAGARVEHQDAEGMTALDRAREAGHEDVLAVLEGMPVSTEAIPPEVRLLEAARAGDPAATRAALGDGAEPGVRDDHRTSRGMTPLMLAAEGGHTEVVRTLLDHRADPNVRDTERCPKATAQRARELGDDWTRKRGLPLGRTALMLAAQRGHLEIVKLLLESRARISSRDGLGFNAFLLACRGGHLDVVDYLHRRGPAVEQKAGQDPALCLAAARGHTAVCRFLLEQGGEVDARNRERWTALMEAAHHGHLATVQVLLEHGADATIQDPEYGTLPDIVVNALRPAESRDHPGVTRMVPLPEEELLPLVEVLVSHGALPGRGGALDTARSNGYQRVLELLEAMAEEEGSTESSTDPRSREAPVPNLSERCTPAFSQALEELTALCGSPPMAHPPIEGAFEFQVQRSDTDEGLSVEQIQDRFLPRGCFVFEPVYSFQREPKKLVALPTQDPYEAVAAMRTNGPIYEIGTGYIIEWLKKLQASHPFALTCIMYNALAGRFRQPIHDADELAERIYEFCPDIVDQDCGTVKLLADELRASQQFFFWWD